MCGLLGFMRIGEFTMVDLSSPPSLRMQDVAVNSRSNPSTICLHLRRSKTDPMGEGVFIFWGIQALMFVRCQPSLHIWRCTCQGDSIYLCGRMANPYPGQSSDICSKRHLRLLAWRPADTLATASILVQQLLQQLQVFQTI